MIWMRAKVESTKVQMRWDKTRNRWDAYRNLKVEKLLFGGHAWWNWEASSSRTRMITNTHATVQE